MLKEYKWTLRRGSKKDICPNCGKRRFVPYVLTADGVTVAGAEYGRCDRETNCGYCRYPGRDVTATAAAVATPRPTLPRLVFDAAAVRLETRQPLFVYVAQLLGAYHAAAIFRRYNIGLDGLNRAIFWQIAKGGEIRAGKSIPYNADGHRDKTDTMPASWLHKSPAWRGMHNNGELQQCFYGEHLLADNDLPVCIAESEKTAAVMSEITHGFVWLACGGSHGLSNEAKNEVLKGREVWLWPDNGQYWSWLSIAEKHGWHVVEICERFPTAPGCDILDLVEAGKFDEYIRK